MTGTPVVEIKRQYANFGNHAEQCLAYMLTGEVRSHDHIRYDKGSDIPEYHMSVKSAKFTLMSGNLCESQDFDGIVEEFFQKTASKQFAYVTQDMVAYIMTAEIFREFVVRFCGLERESSRNGGRYKVKMRMESKKVIEFLKTR
jgi:hypothetical protein